MLQASRTWVAAVAEHTIGLMIDVARGILRANIAYKSGLHPSIGMGTQLKGSTAGIIGYGPLGQRMAQLCDAFGMRLLICDPYVRVVNSRFAPVGLHPLLQQSDFVLLLAAATEETENLIGTAQLAAMKRTAVLVNVSRGNLVDEAALLQALDAGRLAGAALDVGRAPDQMPSADLVRRPDVTGTPHIAGLTQPAIEGQAIETVAQAIEILAGHVPEGAVNAGAASRMNRVPLA